MLADLLSRLLNLHWDHQQCHLRWPTSADTSLYKRQHCKNYILVCVTLFLKRPINSFYKPKDRHACEHTHPKVGFCMYKIGVFRCRLLWTELLTPKGRCAVCACSKAWAAIVYSFLSFIFFTMRNVKPAILSYVLAEWTDRKRVHCFSAVLNVVYRTCEVLVVHVYSNG